MSGITTGVGAFSGINSGQIIDQLIALQSRPKTSSQAKIAGFQKIQAAYMDLSAKTGSLRTIAQSFRLNNIFRGAKASSANESVVTANAAVGAPSGQYSVTVARLASAQQSLSRGFADSTVSGVGLSQIVVEDARGRMDSDTALNQLNGGAGVQRGRIIVTDSAGTRTTVDLTRASTLNDVITAVNDAGAGKFRIAVSSGGTGLTLTDSAGGAGSITVANEGSVTTANDLGIIGTGAGTIAGTQINTLGRSTRLSTLNDGLGVYISTTAGNGRYDFVIRDRTGTPAGEHHINIGDVYGGPNGERTAVAATTLGDVVDRINAQTGGAITASIDAQTGKIMLADNTGSTASSLQVVENGNGSTAADLGLLGSVNASNLAGTALSSKLNSVSMTRLLGGTTIAPDTLTLRTRDGTVQSIDFADTDATGSVTDFVAHFNTQANGKATLSVDSTGTRFVLTDNTVAAGGNQLSLTGTAADALGLQQDPTSADSIVGARTQRQWVGRSTLLSDLNGRRGIGEGRFSITTASGTAVEVNVSSSVRTVGELVDSMNSSLANTDTRARVNDTGDGILIESTNAAAPTAITVRDLSGSVARSLNLNTTSTGTGLANRVDGSYERVITVNPSDTLTQISDALNAAGVGVLSSVVNDGSANPYRLSVTSRASGTAGAITIDTGAVDIGLRTMSQARNALVFYGSDDPTRALAIESNTNSVTNAVPGVTLNLVSSSATPTSVSVTADNEAIVKEVGKFVTAFNALLQSIDSKSTYNADTNTRGVLLGDTTSQQLRRTALELVQTPAEGVNSTYHFLFEVGVQLDNEGNLQLKEEKLRAALEADPQGVADLFAGRVQQANATTRNIYDPDNPTVLIGTVTENVAGAITTRGVFEILADQLESYTRATDGALARRGTTLDSQIKSQRDMIETLDKRLANKRTILQNQFAAMEQAIAKLQGQSGSISNIAFLR